MKTIRRSLSFGKESRTRKPHAADTPPEPAAPPSAPPAAPPQRPEAAEAGVSKLRRTLSFGKKKEAPSSPSLSAQEAQASQHPAPSGKSERFVAERRQKSADELETYVQKMTMLQETPLVSVAIGASELAPSPASPAAAKASDDAQQDGGSTVPASTSTDETDQTAPAIDLSEWRDVGPDMPDWCDTACDSAGTGGSTPLRAEQLGGASAPWAGPDAGAGAPRSAAGASADPSPVVVVMASGDSSDAVGSPRAGSAGRQPPRDEEALAAASRAKARAKSKAVAAAAAAAGPRTSAAEQPAAAPAVAAPSPLRTAGATLRRNLSFGRDKKKPSPKTAPPVPLPPLPAPPPVVSVAFRPSAGEMEEPDLLDYLAQIESERSRQSSDVGRRLSM